MCSSNEIVSFIVIAKRVLPKYLNLSAVIRILMRFRFYNVYLPSMNIHTHVVDLKICSFQKSKRKCVPLKVITLDAKCYYWEFEHPQKFANFSHRSYAVSSAAFKFVSNQWFQIDWERERERESLYDVYFDFRVKLKHICTWLNSIYLN